MKFTKQQIREAVDIVIGDDGFRSKEVIKILEMFAKEEFENKKEIAIVTKWENDKKKTKNMISCIGYRGEK
jgi:hypothetical protein